MGTPIGQTSTTAPSVKLRNVGDHVDLAIVDVEVVPWLEYGSLAPKIGKDGKPRTQERVTALVVAGNGVTTSDDEDVVVKPGETVAVYFSAHRRWEWIQAQRKLDGGLQCGDVVRIKYARDEPGSAGNDKKVWDVQVRHPRPEESAQSQRCEELRAGQQQATPVGAELDDEEPF
jgi:hypothetical protein